MSRLARSLLAQVAGAQRQLGQRSLLSDANVHAARRHVKRARALLRLLRATLGRKSYRRFDHELRDANRELCAGRDRAVVFDTLRATGTLRPHLRAAVSTVHSLLQRHLPVESSLTPAAASSPGHAARTHLLRFSAEFRRSTAPESDAGSISAGVAARYRKGRRLFRRARRTDDLTDWHACRRQTKYLYYQLQWLRPTSSARQAVLRLARGLEETIGKEHDLALLQQALRDYCATSTAAAAIDAYLRQRRRELRSKAAGLAKSTYTDDCARFSRRCLRAIRA